MIEQGSRDKRGEFVRFVLVGSLSAAVNIGTRYGLNLVMPFEIAVIVAYGFGMTTAFLLSKRFVFGSSGRRAHVEFARFTLVNLFAAAQVWLISVGLMRLVFPALTFAWHPEDTAHVVGVAAPVLTSYFAHRHFSFSRARS